MKEASNALEEKISQMTSEKENLLVKIEAGDGANTALTQLKQENVSRNIIDFPQNKSPQILLENVSSPFQESLSGQISSLQDSSEKQSSQQQKTISDLQSKLDETKSFLTLSTEKVGKMEATVVEKNNKIEILQKGQTKLEADLQTKVGTRRFSKTSCSI